jgi:hypothetical protein
MDISIELTDNAFASRKSRKVHQTRLVWFELGANATRQPPRSSFRARSGVHSALPPGRRRRTDALDPKVLRVIPDQISSQFSQQIIANIPRQNEELSLLLRSTNRHSHVL